MNIRYWALSIAVCIFSLSILVTPVFGEETGKVYDVIVIGAGISGISATDALTQMGYDAVALEAKDRVGGRLLTKTWNGTGSPIYLDMGASWIHGVKYNPIFILAEKYGINYTYTILESNVDSHMYYIYGKKLDINQKRFVDKEYEDFLKYLFLKYGYVAFHPFLELTVDRVFAYNTNSDFSVKDALDEYFIVKGITKDDVTTIKGTNVTTIKGTNGTTIKGTNGTTINDINVNTKELFRHLSTFYFVNTWATDIDNISAVHYDVEVVMEGREAIFPGGYDQIAKRLAEEIDFRTEHVVTMINWTEVPIKVHVEVKGEPQLFKANYVISTLPLGVLKKSIDQSKKDDTGFVEFDPKLPDWKRSAINKVGMGTMNKVWLIFNQTFWEDDYDKQYISIMDNDPDWSFVMNVQEILGQPTLLAFHSGKLGEKFDSMDREDIEDIEKYAIANLTAIYDKEGTGIVQNSFKKMIKSSWSIDPYTGGSYSYPAVGSTPTDYYGLAREIDGRLFFAGEATESLHWGTVHGAYLSGIRAAEEVDFRYSWDNYYRQGMVAIAGIAIALGIVWAYFAMWRRNRMIALDVMGRSTQVAWSGTVLVIATIIIIAGVYFWLEFIVGLIPDVFEYLVDENDDCYTISRLADALPYMRLTPQEEEVYYGQLERCLNFG